MALYDYTCKSCDHTFEQSKRISERDEVSDIICPNCGAMGNVDRCVSAALPAYSVTTPGGYGKIPDGFKEVLKKVYKAAPGSDISKTSSYM
jgi:putative FmdB family regulatory protein